MAMWVTTIPPDEQLRLSYRPYRRPFAKPITAAWGRWTHREGIILKLENIQTGAASFGEIAPLSAFGSESIAASAAYLASIPKEMSAASLDAAIEAAPPATAFGTSSAKALLCSPAQEPAAVQSAALVSLGKNTAESFSTLRESGVQTFKLKLGLTKTDEEWELLQQLVRTLQPGDCLRLDPNRSWYEADWHFWKPRLHGISKWIQFIEEPFVEGMRPEDLLQEADRSPVVLALDESLSFDGVEPWARRNWPGYWILKPSLLGSPGRWISTLAPWRNKVVLSSVFETGIGLSALIHLAAEFPEADHGLGTQAFFDDTLGLASKDGPLRALSFDQQESIWNLLPNA